MSTVEYRAVHELAVCQGLLREVRRVASEEDAAAVTKIVIAVGPLSGVESSLLERAFSIARAGTVAGSATLEIEDMPLIVWCESCGLESGVRANALLCSRCGTWKVKLRSGNELLLKRVELMPAGETLGVAGG